MFWLVSTIGTRAEETFSFPLLKHWVQHYLNLGFSPEHWKISLFSTDLSDNMGSVAEWFIAQGIVPQRCYPNSLQYNTLPSTEERYRIRAELPPEDWVVIVDPDEFYAYRKPIQQTLDDMDAAGFDALRGYFVDRVASDFSLPEVTDAPLFEQFPLETSITQKIVKGNHLKIVAVKNSYPTILGHHHVARGQPNYAPEWIKVNHFKWTKGLRGRTLRHQALVDPRYWWRHENENLLKYLTDDQMTFTPEQVKFEPIKDGTP